VLIAAAFCMFNRYVDGLATWAPRDPEVYRAIAAKTAKEGYLKPGGEEPISAKDSAPASSIQ